MIACLLLAVPHSSSFQAHHTPSGQQTHVAPGHSQQVPSSHTVPSQSFSSTNFFTNLVFLAAFFMTMFFLFARPQSSRVTAHHTPSGQHTQSWSGHSQQVPSSHTVPLQSSSSINFLKAVVFLTALFLFLAFLMISCLLLAVPHSSSFQAHHTPSGQHTHVAPGHSQQVPSSHTVPSQSSPC